MKNSKNKGEKAVLKKVAVQESVAKNGAGKTHSQALVDELLVTGANGVDTHEEVTLIPFGKPQEGAFFRIHPTVRADVRILIVKAGSRDEKFLVTKSVASKLDYVKVRTVFLGITSDGRPFLWPIGTGDDSWSDSARRVAVAAMENWLRLVPKGERGVYYKRVDKQEARLPDFQGLDEKPFPELLLLAFDKEHLIDSLEHPVARKVLSE